MNLHLNNNDFEGAIVATSEYFKIPEIFIEKDFDPETKAALTKMGYKITEWGNIGRTELIEIKNKKITAVGDGRGDDDAEGY